MQAPTPEVTDVGTPLFADIMLRWGQYIGSLFQTSEPVTMIPDGFLKPSVDYQLLFFTEVINLKTLVFDCLFVATNTNITVNHNFFLQR